MSEKLLDLQKRVTTAQEQILRIQTLHEERKKRIDEIKEQCRSAGLDPDKLPTEIALLELEEEETAKALSGILDSLEEELVTYNG